MMPPPPYFTAQRMLQNLCDVPPDVLRQLAEGVLRIVNDDKPGVARAAAQLNARITVAAMLRSLADDTEKIGGAGP